VLNRQPVRRINSYWSYCDHKVSIHHLYRIGLNGDVLAQASTSLKIDLPSMEWADHFATTNDAIGKRAPTMGAGIIRGEEATIALPKDRDLGVIHHKRTPLTQGNESDRPQINHPWDYGDRTPMIIDARGKGSAAPHDRWASFSFWCADCAPQGKGEQFLDRLRSFVAAKQRRGKSQLFGGARLGTTKERRLVLGKAAAVVGLLLLEKQERGKAKQKSKGKHAEGRGYRKTEREWERRERLLYNFPCDRHNAQVKQNATLDSSFWINAVAGGLLDYLLDDFVLSLAPAVEQELPASSPSGARLRRLIQEQSITVVAPTVHVLDRFGPGERAAIALAMQHRDWTLLLDDLRPFRAAVEMGLSPVSTPAYAAILYERRVLDEVAVLTVLARLAARGTVSPQLLALALSQVATTLKEQR
jgi:predicted nucleic acid-binding protein